MGRPVEIVDEDVIRAGKAILAESRDVNPTRLWRRVGKHGRPERLFAVWTKHVEASAKTATNRLSSMSSLLPEAALHLLSGCKAQLGAGLDECVREISVELERTLIDRFQAEIAERVNDNETAGLIV